MTLNDLINFNLALKTQLFYIRQLVEQLKQNESLSLFERVNLQKIAVGITKELDNLSDIYAKYKGGQ